MPETVRINSEEGSKERSAAGALPRSARRTWYLPSSYSISISVLFRFQDLDFLKWDSDRMSVHGRVRDGQQCEGMVENFVWNVLNSHLASVFLFFCFIFLWALGTL